MIASPKQYVKVVCRAGVERRPSIELSPSLIGLPISDAVPESTRLPVQLKYLNFRRAGRQPLSFDCSLDAPSPRRIVWLFFPP